MILQPHTRGDPGHVYGIYWAGGQLRPRLPRRSVTGGPPPRRLQEHQFASRRTAPAVDNTPMPFERGGAGHGRQGRGPVSIAHGKAGARGPPLSAPPPPPRIGDCNIFIPPAVWRPLRPYA